MKVTFRSIAIRVDPTHLFISFITGENVLNSTRKKLYFSLLIFVITLGNFNAPASATLPSQEKPEMVGRWQGLLSVGASKLRLVLKVTKAAEGGYNASLDSPDQGASDLTVDSIVLTGNTLVFKMSRIGASYEGTVSGDASEIVGRWKQGPLNAPLVLQRENIVLGPGNFMERGRLKLETCNNPQLTKAARCGKYEVFEDRVAARGRKIALNILVMPATGPKPAADPVFFLAGGPGQGAAAVGSEAGDYLPEIRREHEIVFIDQRGTGASNPLYCRFLGNPDDMLGYFGDPHPPAIVRSCRAELEKVADLTLYTTPVAMDDLEEIRAAMGYDKINLYGGSYGTNAALVYLRLYPGRVRSVVLKGVAPPDFKLPLSFNKGVQHAVDRLIEDCAHDAECGKAFPKFKQEFTEVLARLEKAPANFAVINPVTGVKQQIELSRAAFADSLRLMLYVPDMISLLPLIIHSAYDNDYIPFATYAFLLTRQIEPQLARGMQLSVLCAEHIPFITDADIKRETAGTYYGDDRVKGYRRTCAEWPSAKTPATFLDPVKSDVPVLMVSGDVDPVTPPSYGAAAARSLPNSKQIVIHDGTHLTSSECIDHLVAEFISKGSAAGLDTSCANAIKRPPFLVRYPTALPKP
jgi:pimeloyl-ACP methyl ester carboxylesterase